MRKASTRIAVFLLLGAMANIVVAWGTSLHVWFAPFSTVVEDFDSVGGAYVWWQFQSARRGLTRTASIYDSDDTPGSRRVVSPPWSSPASELRLREIQHLPSPTREVWFVEDQAGWPFRTAACEYRINTTPDWASTTTSPRYGLLLSPERRPALLGTVWIRPPFFCEAITLPLRPIWPGFIINTLFYALLLWLLIAAPFTARRIIRRRRGLCEKCAYPIGVSPVCTECGAAVARKVET